MTDTVTLVAPFQGFYYSIWDDAIDSDLDNLIEHLIETDERAENADRGDLYDAIMRHYDRGETTRDIAKAYAERFAGWLLDALGAAPVPNDSPTFDGLESPRFYNFETDRVFLRLPSSVVRHMRDTVSLSRLRAKVKERHSSRDGFISFYSNDLDEWLLTPLLEWDHNQVTTLLLAWMEAYGYDPDEVEWDIFEGMSSNGETDAVVDVDAALEELAEEVA